MLSPNDRQLLLEDLQPPAGFQLDAAVATTFTLSLRAALIPALAFSTLRLTDVTPDPVVLLESIKRISDRVDVFCQAGAVAVPPTSNDLFAFLEPMIHQVRAPRGGLFHPKLWFLRYQDAAGNQKHRLLVLSRNLTSDATWDVVVRLDAPSLAPSATKGNEPLRELIHKLPGRPVPGLNRARGNRVRKLADEAGRAQWELPPWADGIIFHTDLTTPDLWRSRRTLAISPFVDDAGLTRIKGSDRTFVVARPLHLDLLSPSTQDGLEAFVLNPAAGEQNMDANSSSASDEIEEAPEAVMPPGTGLSADLHAKVYLLEPMDARRTTDRLLVGSANATRNGFAANDEILVEFSARRRATGGIDGLLGRHASEAPGTLEDFLQPYAPAQQSKPDPHDELLHTMQNWLHSVSVIPHTVAVETNADGEHRLILTAEKPYPPANDWDVEIGLLTLRGREIPLEGNGPLKMELERVPTPDISPYITLSVRAPGDVHAATVLVARLTGAPKDRFDQILARQIDTPEKFLRLLHLMLGLLDSNAFIEALEEGASDSGQWGPSTGEARTGGELELILTALAHDAASLKPLDDFVRRLEATPEGFGVLPEGFLKLWNEVRPLLSVKEAR